MEATCRIPQIYVSNVYFFSNSTSWTATWELYLHHTLYTTVYGQKYSTWTADHHINKCLLNIQFQRHGILGRLDLFITNAALHQIKCKKKNSENYNKYVDLTCETDMHHDVHTVTL